MEYSRERERDENGEKVERIECISLDALRNARDSLRIVRRCTPAFSRDRAL